MKQTVDSSAQINIIDKLLIRLTKKKEITQITNSEINVGTLLLIL